MRWTYQHELNKGPSQDRSKWILLRMAYDSKVELSKGTVFDLMIVALYLRLIFVELFYIPFI